MFKTSIPVKTKKVREHRTFETERLIIKPTSTEDAEFILRLLNTPKWIKNIGDRNVKTVEDAKVYILKYS